MSRRTEDDVHTFITPYKVSSIDETHSQDEPSHRVFGSLAIQEDDPASRKSAIPEALLKDLRDYFGMDSHDAQLAGLFLVSLGCKELLELGLLQAEDIRAEAQTATHKPPALIRSKIIEACKILRNGGDLEELRTIGKMRNELVTIKVGEQQFTTNRSTLCRVKGSFLEILFSGRHSNPARRSESGEFFIDRSSKYFPYVLEYLRYGSVLTLPMNNEEKEALALEADFYGLEDLSKAIRGPKVCTAMHLSDKTLALQAKEHALRLKLFSNEGGPIDPAEDLIPLFNDEKRGDYACPILFDPEIDDDAELLFCSNLNRNHRNPGSPTTLPTLQGFETSFNRSHANVLHRIGPILRENPVVIAGGSILSALRAYSSLHTKPRTKDVDVFICTTDKAEAARIAERIWKALAVDHEQWAIVRSPGTCNC